MSLFRTVLYPTDFSACSEAARPLAFEFARHGEALHLLYVDHLFGSAAHAGDTRQRLKEAGADAPIPVDIEVVRDLAPGPAILHYAEHHDADLIVLGTHGRRGLSRLLLGSTAREVVQFAPCPVLTVRSDADDTGLPHLQGGSLLVAVDFSDSSREALRQAVRLAETFDARIDLVHVIEDLFQPVGVGYTLRSVFEMEPDIESRLEEALHVFREEVAPDSSRFGRMEVRAGIPTRVLTEVAESFGSRLLVLGTKGLRGFDHLVMGSVAEAVVRTAPCPVLTVKAADSMTAAREAIQAARETPDTAPSRITPTLVL
jgi:nucleotide-binding universal stress UspA family protein